jgi:hypothetical protein
VAFKIYVLTSSNLNSVVVLGVDFIFLLGQVLALWPAALHFEHLILTPPFLMQCGFLGSSGPLLRNFLGRPGAALTTGGSTLSCPVLTHWSSLGTGYIIGS